MNFEITKKKINYAFTLFYNRSFDCDLSYLLYRSTTKRFSKEIELKQLAFVNKMLITKLFHNDVSNKKIFFYISYDINKAKRLYKILYKSFYKACRN
jgi:hypothetical protein